MKLSATRRKAVFARNRTLSLTTLLATGLLLAACQQPAPVPGDEGYTTEQAQIQRAEELLRRASTEGSPRQEQLQLQAAELLHQEQQSWRALQVINSIRSEQLTLQPLARYSLLGAEIALADDNFFTARGLLTHPALELHYRKLPLDMQQRWHRYRADIFGLLGEEERSLDEYIALSATLATPAAISDVHQRLWQVLGRMPQDRLQRLIETEPDRVRRGWYSLAGLSRNNPGDIRKLQEDIQTWQANWAWHPAALSPPAGLNTIDQIANNLPRQLALLLPLTGKYKNPGKTLQDGFMAAYYDVIERGGTPPRIRIYDTGAGESIAATYQQAVNEGAQLVIGPLSKEGVEALNQLPQLAVPTVTLNYLQDEQAPATANLYQFGLSTADEARQIARRGWLEGHRRALAVTPDTNLGTRVANAFRDEWESLGGTLVASSSYPKGQNDFKPLIRPLLLVNQSQQRATALGKLLGKPLVNTPERRRQDVDMVFMHAVPDRARQIKPMFDFFYAAELPVYATSHVYAGSVDPGKDSDLNRVRFCAMPWTLPGSLTDNMKPDSKLHPNFQQLYALGLDAYQIHQGVLQMRALPNTRLFGSTGTLRLEQQRILREQPWAEFRGGKVRPARLPKPQQ